MPEQYCPPDPHTQLPLEHCSLSAHAWPQPPQLELSVSKFTQDFPHAASGPAQLVAQAPFEQTWFEVQATPHAPQFAGSSDRTTQRLPHFVRPGPQVQLPE
jgi:hypothetical protein